jgi:hypothetical protein
MLLCEMQADAKDEQTRELVTNLSEFHVVIALF